MQLPVERNTPPATEPFAPVLEARSSTGSGSSAGRRGFEAFAEGVKKSSTPRTARCECAPRQSPYEEAKHVAFVAGLGPTSTPRVASETSAGCNGFEGFAEGVKKSSTPWIARCDRAPHQQRRSTAEDVSTLVTELPQAKAGIERIGHCPPHSKLADDGSEHTVFAAGLQASSTASAARAIAVSRPRQETQKPAEHNTPPATESSVPVPEVRSSTGSKSSAGRRGFGALAEGVKKRLTPRTARWECAPRHSPHEEAKHTAFVAGLGPTSTPWAAYPQRFPQPSVERRRPADVKNELRDTSRKHRAQPSTHSPTLSTTSLKAGSLPRPDVVESASSEGRYAKFIARLNAMSTPRDVQERLRRRVQSAKGQRNDSSNSPPPQARTGKPLDSPSPQPEIASKLQLPRLMDNEDRFKAFASGVQATSTPPSVTAPPAPQRPSEPSSLPPPPPPPASAPAPSAPSPPTPPVKTNGQHNDSDNGSAPQAHTGKPLSLSSPHSEIASKPPTSPCLTKSEDWYKAFALGVQATSTPPSVTPPPALQQPSGPSCPLSLPPPVSAPAPPSSPSPPPVVKTNEKAKQKPQMPTSESFFRPRSIKSPLSKPVQKFVLKSCIPPLPEFIEGSSKDGLPLGKTPAVVRYRRESRYIPGSPETPCRESKAKGSSSKVFDRLERMLGALNRQRDGVDQ
ncbi:hypothetical protein BDY19DRAFT_1059328 [Irpex rosettiformis]|uniref:Uncharacterized protein n=1 Tax=Irpex rosettiformis TaxID=378272 RepID=A0ACB8TUU1_9APHY|nr:hypothetical protein BDY19DRAFT_1059328 [Irpex rosettiformis]